MFSNIKLRYEPIKILTSQDLRLVGYEILTVLPGNINTEFFFNEITSHEALTLCAKQIKKTEGLPEDLTFFVNIPVRSLIKKETLRHLSVSNTHRIALEIQDVNNLIALNYDNLNILKNNLHRIRKLGYLIWLDDVKKEFMDHFFLGDICVDGIKIDKSELKMEPWQLTRLVNSCRKVTGSIIIEGIETYDDLLKSTVCGADMGQGYLWESEFLYQN